ncbi:hypothetical protein B0H11DRAFT_1928743 [Mycena galericulata]|nr:hypothetical protein B0H11DRAFT_1928743 [Mycena galericulata]
MYKPFACHVSCTGPVVSTAVPVGGTARSPRWLGRRANGSEVVACDPRGVVVEASGVAVAVANRDDEQVIRARAAGGARGGCGVAGAAQRSEVGTAATDSGQRRCERVRTRSDVARDG